MKSKVEGYYKPKVIRVSYSQIQIDNIIFTLRTEGRGLGHVEAPIMPVHYN